MFKKVAFNTFSQIIAKVITAGSTLIITLLIGKTLGPAGYGDFTKIFAFAGYFYTFGDFGLNAVFIKKSQSENIESLFRLLIATRLLLGLMLALVAIALSFALPYNINTHVGFSPLVKAGILLSSLTIITQTLVTTSNALFQKKLRYDLSAICAIFGSIVILISTAIASKSGYGIIAYTSAYVIGGLTFVFSSYFIIGKKFHINILPNFKVDESLRLLKQSVPIGLALIFNLVYFRADIFILSANKSSFEVGQYGLAYQFFEASLSIPIFLVNSLYPLLSEIFIKNREDFKKSVKKSLILLMLSSVALSSILFLISLIIPILYDSRYIGTKDALQILSLGMPFFFVSALLWHILIIQNKEKLLSPIYLFGAGVNIILNLMFIPVYGFLAAASITVISEAIITLFLLIAILKPNLTRANNPAVT